MAPRKRDASAPPKGAAKAKSKAKGTPKVTASKGMTEEELKEYGQIHSKLTYRVKSGIPGASEALDMLKQNRQVILDKFRGDKSMAWIGSN